MNIEMAQKYAEQQYGMIPRSEDAEGRLILSKALVVSILANAFIDGCICAIKDQMKTSRTPISANSVCAPITAKVQSPTSPEWGSPEAQP